MPPGLVWSLPLSPRSDCGPFVTESAHRVRPACDSVALEGGGKPVPTQGGGYRRVTHALDLPRGEVAA